MEDLYHWREKRYSVVHHQVTRKLESTSNLRQAPERDAFPALCDRLDERDYDYVLVSWYRSHPGYTSFLSAVDMNTQGTDAQLTRPCGAGGRPGRLGMNAFHIREECCLEVPPYAMLCCLPPAVQLP